MIMATKKKQLKDKKREKELENWKESGKETRSETIQLLDKAGLTDEAIFKELALMGLSDIADYLTIDEGGALQAKTFEKMEKGKSRAVKKVREKTTITENKDGSHIFKNSQVEYELHDKIEPLKIAIAIKGLKAPDKLEIKTDIAEMLAAARLRVKEMQK
jgi:predicted metal-dependent peptidase